MKISQLLLLTILINFVFLQKTHTSEKKYSIKIYNKIFKVSKKTIEKFDLYKTYSSNYKDKNQKIWNLTIKETSDGKLLKQDILEQAFPEIFYSYKNKKDAKLFFEILLKDMIDISSGEKTYKLPKLSLTKIMHLIKLSNFLKNKTVMRELTIPFLEAISGGRIPTYYENKKYYLNNKYIDSPSKCKKVLFVPAISNNLIFLLFKNSNDNDNTIFTFDLSNPTLKKLANVKSNYLMQPTSEGLVIFDQAHEKDYIYKTFIDKKLKKTSIEILDPKNKDILLKAIVPYSKENQIIILEKEQQEENYKTLYLYDIEKKEKIKYFILPKPISNPKNLKILFLSDPNLETVSKKNLKPKIYHGDFLVYETYTKNFYTYNLYTTKVKSHTFNVLFYYLKNFPLSKNLIEIQIPLKLNNSYTKVNTSLVNGLLNLKTNNIFPSISPSDEKTNLIYSLNKNSNLKKTFSDEDLSSIKNHKFILNNKVLKLNNKTKEFTFLIKTLSPNLIFLPNSNEKKILSLSDFENIITIFHHKSLLKNLNLSLKEFEFLYTLSKGNQNKNILSNDEKSHFFKKLEKENLFLLKKIKTKIKEYNFKTNFIETHLKKIKEKKSTKFNYELILLLKLKPKLQKEIINKANISIYIQTLKDNLYNQLINSKSTTIVKGSLNSLLIRNFSEGNKEEILNKITFINPTLNDEQRKLLQKIINIKKIYEIKINSEEYKIYQNLPTYFKLKIYTKLKFID